MKIELDQITKTYGAQTVFKDISAVFETTKRYPIIGQNGSGKSTLLQVISGFVTPNKGSICYKDHAGIELPIEAWYKHQSIAAPYLDLFEELSVSETVFVHGKLKPLALDQNALLADIALDKHAEKPLSKLSSGMRQRLKLALAIYSETEILLLDEPTSNLDKKWVDWFQDRTIKNSKDRIVIVCTNSQEAELAITDQPALELKN